PPTLSLPTPEPRSKRPHCRGAPRTVKVRRGTSHLTSSPDSSLQGPMGTVSAAGHKLVPRLGHLAVGPAVPTMVHGARAPWGAWHPPCFAPTRQIKILPPGDSRHACLRGALLPFPRDGCSDGAALLERRGAALRNRGRTQGALARSSLPLREGGRARSR